MAARVALCADELALRNPGLIGLEGETLESQEWLRVFQGGEEARSSIDSDEGIDEVWVASCDDVESINLAATLKADRPELSVMLVEFDAGGSVLSRAHTASIDEVLGLAAFAERYAAVKQSCAPAPAEAPAPVAMPAFGNLPATDSEARVDEKRGAHIVPVPAPSVASTRGFVLPVVSGSGGAGKSAIATLAAHLAYRMGYRTLLLDYDLQFGDLAALNGLDDPLALDEAIAHPDKLERECAAEGRPVILAAPERLEVADGLSRLVPDLLDRLTPAFDVIVANTGAAWAEYHAALIERCSAALFLIDQRSSSVRACKHALELCGRCGIATGQFQFAVNRCSKNAPLTALDVSCALQGANVAELRDGGRDVEDYLASGSPGELIDTGNELSVSLGKLLADVLPGNPAGASAAPAKASARRRGLRVGKRKGWRK